MCLCALYEDLTKGPLSTCLNPISFAMISGKRYDNSTQMNLYNKRTPAPFYPSCTHDRTHPERRCGLLRGPRTGFFTDCARESAASLPPPPPGPRSPGYTD